GRARACERGGGGPPVLHRHVSPALPGGLHAGRPPDPGALPRARRIGADDGPRVPRRDLRGRDHADHHGPGEADRSGAAPGRRPAVEVRGRCEGRGGARPGVRGPGPGPLTMHRSHWSGRPLRPRACDVRRPRPGDRGPGGPGRPESKGGRVLITLRTWLEDSRDRLWFLPAILTLTAIVLAALTAYVDLYWIGPVPTGGEI